VKPGFKTSELLLTVAAIVLTSLDAIPEHAQPKVIAAAIGYAIARGLAKLGHGLLAGDPGIDLEALPDPVVTDPPPPAAVPHPPSPPEPPPATV
jgi:hypothetical protein